jgi:hypothetical protein
MGAKMLTKRMDESISVVKVSRDGLPLDKGSGNAANHEIENQQFYLKFQKYVKL